MLGKLFRVVLDSKTILLKAEKGKRVWVNERQNVVLKCCWSKWNKISASRNHEFIQTTEYPYFPSISYVYRFGFLHFYMEELLQGKKVVIAETPFEMIPESINNLSKFHEGSSEIIDFDFDNELQKYHALLMDLPMELNEEISGLFSLINEQLPKTARLKLGNIHGDLTFRNILMSENQFSYIDFEHSEYSLPEFDYVMLRLDWEVYQHERVTYEKYFKILISYLKENVLEDFYNQCPCNQNYNMKFTREILLLFIFRFLVYRINSNLYDETEKVLLIVNYLHRKIGQYAK